MALKHKITEDEFKKLNEVIQEEYTKVGDEYILDVEGLEDPDRLRRAHERTKADNKRLKEDIAARDEEIATLKKNGGNADIGKLEKQWKEKHDTEVKGLTDKLAQKDALIVGSLKTSFADTLAAKISTAPSLMKPIILDRLTVEFDDEGKPSLTVLGNDRKSVITPEQFEKELTKTKEYAPILLGSRATGSADSGSRNSPPPADGGSPENRDWARATAAELRAHIAAKKAAE